MSEKLGEAPKEMGGPEVAPDPRLEEKNGFELGRPRLGGLDFPVQFSEQQTAILNAAADEIIPPGGGFPAPSEVNIVNFIGRYLAPSGEDPIHYPFAGEDDFKAAVDSLGEDFLSDDSKGRVETLERVEKEEEAFFDQLRSLVYYGYYSMTEVTLAIRKNLPAGRDYHGPPQPYGYISTIEWWDEDTLASRGGGCDGYIATEDVERVDLSKVDWIKNGK